MFTPDYSHHIKVLEDIDKERKMDDKNLTMRITERHEIEMLCNIFGEEDMFNLRVDYDDNDEEIEYELEVRVRRMEKKENA